MPAMRLSDPKPRPNHARYIQTLQRLSPEQRLLKAFELTQFTRELLRHGLRRLYPEADEQGLKTIFLQRLEKCHNRNY